jgi:hypothetical protein
METTSSTANDSKPKAALPPTVITVDTSGKEPAADATPSKDAGDPSKDFGQARTPKHANKTNNDEHAKEAPITPERRNHQGHYHERDLAGGRGHQHQQRPGGPPPGHPGYHERNYPPPNRPFEGRMGGSGAFHPREQRQGFPGRGPPPMQVSPGGGRYYPNPNNPNNYNNNPNNGPSRYNNGPYDQRYSGEYQRFEQHNAPSNYQRAPYGGPPPMFPPQQQFSGYDPSNQPLPPSWGPPPSFPHGRPPQFAQGGMPPEHYHRGPLNANNNTFSRAVSSSFDRSIKSHAQDDKQGHGGSMDVSPKLAPGHPLAVDNGSVSEDGSWGALKQVTSVDEDVMLKRSQLHEQSLARKEVKAAELPQSTSSSLTNSPTDGNDSKKAAMPDPDKLTCSLDSLSSVASAQKPIETSKAAAAAAAAAAISHSPGGSAGSLDLMKCASGSSGLLPLPHQRSLSQFSFPFPETEGSGKRARDEERGDMSTKVAADAEIRRDPSEVRPAKKGRVDSNDLKKTSPLSIQCSPPTSPSGDKRKGDNKTHHPQPVYAHPTSKDQSATSQIDSFYDKEPSFTYSMDSAPTMPVAHMGPRMEYLHLPRRPGSSSSSTITPMNVDVGGDHRQPPALGQINSWEIRGQDSFGGDSAGGGGPLIPNFSFTQDYPMLARSESLEHAQQMGQHMGPHPHNNNGQQHLGRQDGQALESRNQSFEGGHYHGSFNRSDSMMSYEGQRMNAPSFEGRQGQGGPGPGPGYQGPFPPQAQSWGSAGSFPHPPPPGYGQYRRGGPQFPGMMRNYSEDSGRTSPPQGPPGLRVMPPNFQPPPEFRAPPSMVTKVAPQNAHIMSASPYVSSKNGPFGWSKEEDMRLTEIMKKYKNPRDWEPISKEHNRGRS